jgi:transposase-like protein
MHHAVRLVSRYGLSVAEAASRLQLSESRVERLLEQYRDRELVTAYVLDEIRNDSLRHILAAARRADPELTVAELARRIGSTQVQVERWLGLRETAPKTDAAGRLYAPKRVERISVGVAGRLVRAMGYAPCEVDGC